MTTQKQSYLEKLELKRSAMLAAGLISERFPEISNIVFRMTYYQRTSDPVLMVRTVNFFPHRLCLFSHGLHTGRMHGRRF